MLGMKHKEWHTQWDSKHTQLVKQVNMVKFNHDMSQINQQLHDLNNQLMSMRGNYGNSLAAATATSTAFNTFERTIHVS